MSGLREDVIIKTATTDLKGVLFAGIDGLPELRVDGHPWSIRPALLPGAWSLRAVDPRRDVNGADEGVLIAAWAEIERIQRQIAVAQKEAER